MMRRAKSESGIAMITAVVVLSVASGLSVIAFKVSNHSLNTTGTERKRVQAIGVAEAGLDLGLSRLTTTPLPCTVSGTLATAPSTGTFNVTVTYYATYPVTGAALGCTPGVGPSSTPAAAEVVSTGTTSFTGYGQRKMQALVRLAAVPTGSLDKAIFSESALIMNNKVTVYGNVGNDGNLYTNSSWTCNNAQTINGSAYVQGLAVLNNACAVTVDLYAKGAVTANVNTTIGHDMKSSTGAITMGLLSNVGHDAIAHLTNIGGHVGNSRVSGASLADPPYQAFPTLEFDSAAWAAAGYTRQLNDGGNCAQTLADIAAMNVAATPTVIQTSCLLTWPANTTVNLKQNLAIFSTGGYLANSNFTVQSTDATKHNFYMVVPKSASLLFPCVGALPGITLNSGIQFKSSIDVFMYTPCSVIINANDAGYGQIYAGSVVINTNFTLHYFPMSVPGVTFSGAVSSYTTDLVYKREVVG